MRITYQQNELASIAKKIIDTATSKILLFYGSMGVGKTTLIKEISHQLGTFDDASSPSFSIVNEYEIPEGCIYHFDFYRIQKPQEALDLGFEDYLYSGNYVFIEWPEKIEILLPEDAVVIEIIKNKDNTRTLELKNPRK